LPYAFYIGDEELSVHLVYYLILFDPYALEKRFYGLSPNLSKKIGIFKSTSLSPSTSMKYKDTMKVMRKMKHHCLQDEKTHSDVETEGSLHLHHLAR
jgi:hypothetical protein